MINILVADDHPIVRQGLKGILSSERDMAVLGEAQDGREVLRLLGKEEWDVLILDISMPGKDGLELLQDLKRLRPKLPVLILSGHPEEQYAMRVLKAGASGYLTKESALEELVTAIRKVLSGRKYISAALAERLLFEIEADGEKPLHESLSGREYQVMCMLASGKTGSEIADELLLSVKTVSTYRTRILAKMGLKNNAELIRYAVDNHLVD